MQIFINALSIIASLLLLSVLVTVHELGHFSIGRLFNFRIEEFAIGLGPKVLSRERKGILYSIRALPIGGMCRFFGEDEGIESAESMNAQKPWKRLLVILAGPVMNVLFTFLLAFLFLLNFGGFSYVPVVDSLSEDVRVAAEAGVQPGDILYAVDGVQISRTQTDSAAPAIRNAGDSMVLTVERNGELIDFELQPQYDTEAERSFIGVQIVEQIRRIPMGFGESLTNAVPFVVDIIRQTFQAIGSLFQNGVRQGDVMGMVGTVATISYAVRTNFEIVLHIAILLSISLAIFNLLPIPALDGGRIVFILIEMVRGKPIAPEKEGMVHFIGFVVLIGLVVLITFNDIRMLTGN